MVFESTSEAEQQHAAAESSGTRWVFLLAFAVLASLAVLIVYSRFSVPVEQMGDKHPGVGNSLSALSVEPFIDAEQSFTRADLIGHVTLINYWGPWCPPCRIEMPHLVEIEKDYRRHEQFQLLSIACGTWVYSSLNEMRIETAKYHEQAKLGFPVYIDPNFTSRKGLESDIGLEPGSMPYPTTVLIDEEGKIAGVWHGYSPSVPSQITALIDQLIAES